MTVEPKRFATAMADHWTQNLKNVSSPQLEASWLQFAEVLNAQILEQPLGLQVLQPPTGTGKTKCLELYCSQLSALKDHPGVLIVTKLIEEADTLANNINSLTGNTGYAVAYHSGDTCTADYEAAYNAPILIITHAAYLIWAQYEYTPREHQKWKLGQRKLIVIDEAINLVDVQTVNLDQAIQSLTQIPQTIREKWPEEHLLLGRILNKMQAIRSETISGIKWIEPTDWKIEISNITQLKREISHLSLDKNWLGHLSSTENSQLQQHLRDQLDSLVNITKTWSVFTRKGDASVFTTAKVVTPPHKLNAIILDATASHNSIYNLLASYAYLHKPPEKIRSYSNVTLHVSFDHKVGKTALAKFDEQEIAKALGGLATELKPDDRLFICTHKCVRAKLGGFDTLPDGYQIAHWGAVDGRNDWHSFNKAFLYGLPYLDTIAPQVILRALEEWRGWQYPDNTRQAHLQQISEGHIITSMVQAINRIQCRHVIDEQGNCPQTDIFLLLPTRSKAERILTGIAELMAGVQIKLWDSKATRQKIKRNKHEHALITYFETAPIGKYTASDIRAKLKIATTTFERLTQKAKDESSALCQNLNAVAVQYISIKSGRGNHAWFEKLG